MNMDLHGVITGYIDGFFKSSSSLDLNKEVCRFDRGIRIPSTAKHLPTCYSI